MAGAAFRTIKYVFSHEGTLHSVEYAEDRVGRVAKGMTWFLRREDGAEVEIIGGWGTPSLDQLRVSMDELGRKDG